MGDINRFYNAFAIHDIGRCYRANTRKGSVYCCNERDTLLVASVSFYYAADNS